MTEPTLKEIFKVFLRLGCTAFGGPAAHMAMMRTEVVEKRKWLTENELMDLIGAANLIPGPNSTELAIFIGAKLQGFRGLLVSGLTFILPAFFMVLGLAWLYVKMGLFFPDTNYFLMGMRPAVFAIVIVAIYKFSKTAITNKETLFVGALSFLMSWFGVHELVVIFGLGLLNGCYRIVGKKKLSLSPELFLFFLKVGSVLFGSGYVLLAYLQKGLVEDHHWLSEMQLMDAITIGQVTPGPVFTTATFIGYLVNGFEGATVSTIGIFLPSFILVAAVTPFITRLRKSVFFSAFLDGVNAASVGLMIYVLILLGQESLNTISTITLGAICLFMHVKFPKINSAILIVTGGIIFFLLKP
jgi:chromate transporter